MFLPPHAFFAGTSLVFLVIVWSDAADAPRELEDGLRQHSGAYLHRRSDGLGHWRRAPIKVSPPVAYGRLQ